MFFPHENMSARYTVEDGILAYYRFTGVFWLIMLHVSNI